MIDRRLQRQLDEVAIRYRRLRVTSWLSIVWIVLATIAAVLISLNRTVGFYVRGEAAMFVAIGSVTTVAVWLLALRAGRDPRWLARRIETRYPQLQARLLTAVEQQPELPDGRFGYLQMQVIQEALAHGYRHDWRHSLSHPAYIASWLASLAAAALVAVATAGLFRYLEPTSFSLAPLLGWERDLRATSPTTLVSVDPGNTEVERGSSLLVLATFAGQLPLQCTLETITDDAGVRPEISMSQSLQDPVFAGRIGTVDEPLSYRVRYLTSVSDTFRVTVFDYPALVTADAVLDFPEFTALETKTVQDVRHVTAVEGTLLTLICHLNKPVVEAELQEDEKPAYRLQPDETAESTYRITFPLVKSQRLSLHLLDDAARPNKQPAEFVITVTPNRPPDLKLTFPSRDMEVSPLEELEVVASVWDDYQLSRAGVTYQLGDNPPQEVTLATSIITGEKTSLSHLLACEDLQAKPNQLLSYHFWAEDLDTEGQPRRSMSDMFFAEVRPFDEIYRQGQQPPGGESPDARQPQDSQSPPGAGNQVQELADQQKEILNATWNILRRETSQQVSPQFAEDVAVVRDAQSSLHDRIEQLAEQVDDAQAEVHLSALTTQMNTAVGELTRATDDREKTPLAPALQAEQAAYQTLLQLRAREHEVIRSSMQNAQQARSSGGSNSRSQQQLQQLALANDENRYETEREASAQQEDSGEREQRQILNRLRELARRQNDLNQRLQELQAQLEQAENQQEREELLKQLKRLREQQEEILRDTDELNSRLNQSDNPQDMNEPQQRLQQARENVRQASEALEEGRLSQALSSGTRAQSELDDLRDEFRQRTSQQFDEEARQLQQQADELAQKQRELGQQLNQQESPDPNEPRSLRQPSAREDVLQQMQQQNERLTTLLEQMQQTIQEAEQPQPLLAQQLYDSFRQARQDRVGENLEETERSMRRGLWDDARQMESSARQGIERLRDSIQQAAESVLGDENEALRRAREQLDQLSRELNEEIRRAVGDHEAQRDDRKLNPSDAADAPSRTAREGDRQEDAGQTESRSGKPSDRRSDSGGNSPAPRENSEGNQHPDEQQAQTPGEGNEGEQQQQQQQQRGGGSPGESDETTSSNRSGRQASDPDESADDESGNEQSNSETPWGQENSGRRVSPGQDRSPQDGQPQDGSAQGEDRQADVSPDRTRGQGEEDSRNTPHDPSAVARRPNNVRDGIQMGGPGSGYEEDRGPLTGSEFRQWAERLRDVEEMISDPQLKSEAARIRDRAKEIRSELIRHSQAPNWDLVKMTISQPLVELRDRIGEQLQKRISKTSLVPIDRDPVPPPYAEQVRRYYERIGSGQ